MATNKAPSPTRGWFGQQPASPAYMRKIEQRAKRMRRAEKDEAMDSRQLLLPLPVKFYGR